MSETFTELPWLYTGLSAYFLATVAAFYNVFRDRVVSSGAAMTRPRSNEHLVLGLMVSGVIFIAIALGDRWIRIGHGPFVNLFELLISQLFSLGLIFTLVYWRAPVVRPTTVVVLPLMWVLGAWVLTLTPTDSPFPPTYHNNWLWAHVGFGKIFLSFAMVGTGVAGVILLRGFARLQPLFHRMPTDAVLDSLAWRFMMIAFLFHTLMLIAGAVWAQDAWGRYWAWDALETSSFLNWLLLGAAIHVRLTYRVPVRAAAATIVVIFVFAFLTYFGAPFYSEAAHKGVI